MGAGPVATFVKPDSVLARTAREVMQAHGGGAGPRDGMITCPVCGEPLPCTSGRAAAEVLFAAGLAESSGLVDAARGGLGPASPLGLPSQSFTDSLLNPGPAAEEPGGLSFSASGAPVGGPTGGVPGASGPAGLGAGPSQDLSLIHI